MLSIVEMVFIAGAVLFGLIVIGLILARMYRRASKEISFVRTGFRGQRVIMNGGALVFPVLHEIIQVNMNTLRLEVQRANQAALITKDRMRVDVQAEFYVRVQPTEDSIANAAQTLGQRTMAPEALKELVEGKFVDALRSVAAEMPMEDLHEQRASFVQKVQATVAEDLLKNGLELESVSLTGLDQTRLEFLNPQNAFDAEGLTRLTEQIESRRKQRNEIEQDTQVAIQQKDLEAEKLKLNVSRESEYARLDQEREVAVRRAKQNAEVAREQAEKEQEARQAQIGAKQRIDQSDIEAQRVVQEQRIDMERQVAERDIEKKKAVERAEIERRKSIELSEQDRAIAVAEKSKSQSEAQAEADKALSLAVQAEESVVTVREKERAERAKTIELVKASENAERDAISITVAAQAEKRVAEDRAIAVRTLATAEADKVKISAQGDAEAEKMRAEAAERCYEVDSEGKRRLNEAENILSPEIIAMQIKLALLQALPGIIEQSVKPMEAIEGIKIVQVEGLSGNGSGASRDGGGAAVANTAVGSGNLADQVVNSALRYRAQAPLVDSLMSELGMAGGDINQLTNLLTQATSGKAPANGSPISGASVKAPSAPGASGQS